MQLFLFLRFPPPSELFRSSYSSIAKMWATRKRRMNAVLFLISSRIHYFLFIVPIFPDRTFPQSRFDSNHYFLFFLPSS